MLNNASFDLNRTTVIESLHDDLRAFMRTSRTVTRQLFLQTCTDKKEE
jgi:hypothetical protein